jgi:hypothetical protein
MASKIIIGSVGCSKLVRGLLLAGLLGCAPLDDDHGGVSSEPQAATAITKVYSGFRTSYFTATSSTSVTLSAGTTLTQVTSSPGTVTYRINNGSGGGLYCRCDGGCGGACTAEVRGGLATCSGSCSGLSSDGSDCGARGCTFHYGLPAPRTTLR